MYANLDLRLTGWAKNLMNPATKVKSLLRTAAPGIYETLQGLVADRSYAVGLARTNLN